MKSGGGTVPPSPMARLEELGVDEALGWIEPHERQELDALRRRLGQAPDDSLQLTAAMIALAAPVVPAEMPGELRRRIEAEARQAIRDLPQIP